MVTFSGTPMAKKPAAKANQPKVRSSDGVRAFALKLHEVAKEIEDFADEMDKANINSLVVLDGNFQRGVKILNEWIGTQLTAKFVSKATKKGLNLFVRVSRPNDNSG
jgi:hypothetical protein